MRIAIVSNQSKRRFAIVTAHKSPEFCKCMRQTVNVTVYKRTFPVAMVLAAFFCVAFFLRILFDATTVRYFRIRGRPLRFIRHRLPIGSAFRYTSRIGMFIRSIRVGHISITNVPVSQNALWFRDRRPCQCPKTPSHSNASGTQFVFRLMLRLHRSADRSPPPPSVNNFNGTGVRGTRFCV
jgi:hypothetical protein